MTRNKQLKNILKYTSYNVWDKAVKKYIMYDLTVNDLLNTIDNSKEFDFIGNDELNSILTDLLVLVEKVGNEKINKLNKQL